MRSREIQNEDFQGVFAVPPLARNRDGDRTISHSENGKIIRYIEAGGITRIMYGGNAAFYHITLKEFETCLELVSEAAGADVWVIPGVGPSFGRAVEQARVLRDFTFPVAMYLPASDPKDDEGVYRGISEFVERSGKPVILYVKSEAQLDLDSIRRLFDDGSAVGMKYAVVREDPARDEFLERLLDLIDRRRVLSGIGERPAPAHLLRCGLPGYTTGSGCLAPRSASRMFELLDRKEAAAAEEIRRRFLPLEDLRDRCGAVRVLHEAFRLAEVADTGPLPPLFSNLTETESLEVAPVARALLELERTA